MASALGGRLRPSPPFDLELSFRFACRAPRSATPSAGASRPAAARSSTQRREIPPGDPLPADADGRGSSAVHADPGGSGPARRARPAPSPAPRPSGLSALDHWQGREYRRVVWLAGTPWLLRLKSCGLVDRPEVAWRLEGDAAAAPPARANAEALVRRIISADLDLPAFYRALAADNVLADLARRFHGLRLIRFPSLYECLVSTVLEQQLNYLFANTVKRRLAEAAGPRIEFDGKTYHGLPCAADLAGMLPADLRALQISLPKARYLLALAAAAAQGGLDEDRLARLPLDEATAALRQFAGVGDWTAAYALLRGLGHTDALPAGDVGLQRAVAALYDLRAPATPLAIQRRWRSLAPWRGYATFYSWFTLW